jgi:hypothetical protein
MFHPGPITTLIRYSIELKAAHKLGSVLATAILAGTRPRDPRQSRARR